MRRLKKLGILAVVIALAVLGSVFIWQHGQPRRAAAQALFKLASALANPDHSQLLDAIVLPDAVRGRTSAEQQEFIAKALADELSTEGVLALKRHSEFGSLALVFPNEAAAWSRQAGVDISDCVAFKMERAGIHAEVVLVRAGQTYRVVRCNNVKQMAVSEGHS